MYELVRMTSLMRLLLSLSGVARMIKIAGSISEFVNKHYMTILVIGLFLSLFLVKCDGSVDINIGGL
jgi:hypothetical protein